jgi:hypothetical protein
MCSLIRFVVRTATKGHSLQNVACKNSVVCVCTGIGMICLDVCSFGVRTYTNTYVVITATQAYLLQKVGCKIACMLLIVRA